MGAQEITQLTVVVTRLAAASQQLETAADQLGYADSNDIKRASIQFRLGFTQLNDAFNDLLSVLIKMAEAVP